jgi:hypothetical protein
MSNLRQLHTYAMIYATDNQNFCLPANNIRSRWEAGDWYGILTRTYFRAKMTGANGDYLYGAAAFAEINRTSLGPFLYCPANTRPEYDPAAGLGRDGASKTPIPFMYIYNRGFGDFDKLGGIASPTPTELVQYGMKKRNQVPGSVFVAADMAPWLPNNRGANNYRFVTFAREVNPLDGSWGSVGGYVGSPHGTKDAPRANVLLFNGAVLTVDQKKFNDLPNRYLVDARDWGQGAPNRRITAVTEHRLD